MVNTFLNFGSRYLHVLVLGLALLQAAAGEELSLEKCEKLPEKVQKANDTITGKAILSHARVLSDQAFRGREAGKAGVRGAAQYIADEFRKARLSPGGSAGSYFQSFKIRAGYTISGEMKVWIGEALVGDFKRGEDFIAVRLPGGSADLKAECVLAGYGISAPEAGFDEYARMKTKGRAVIVFSGHPWSNTIPPGAPKKKDQIKYATLAYKARNAADHGAVCMLVVANPVGWRKQLAVPERLRVPDVDLLPNIPIPVIQITRQVLAKMTAMKLVEIRALAGDMGEEGKPQSMLLKGRKISFKAELSGRARLGRNVIGIIPGNNADLEKQAVVFGAHYDHLGEGDKSIFFGANDNAAGVGALIALVRAFNSLGPCPRTLIFIAFDAEEIGRLGSHYYLTKPCIPAAQTNIMINLDMIGKNEPDGIYVVGTPSGGELHRIHQQLNKAFVGLKLTHPASYRLGLSDHSPFYHAGVPIMYLFGGLDDDYSTPEDTWDKLIGPKMEKVARLAFLTGWESAQRADRYTFTRKKELEW